MQLDCVAFIAAKTETRIYGVLDRLDAHEPATKQREAWVTQIWVTQLSPVE